MLETSAIPEAESTRLSVAPLLPVEREPMELIGIEDLPTYTIPEAVQEPSILNVLPHVRDEYDDDDDTADDDVTYEFLEVGSQKQHPKLVSSDGYQYGTP